jgi:hypothetical protein
MSRGADGKNAGGELFRILMYGKCGVAFPIFISGKFEMVWYHVAACDY